VLLWIESVEPHKVRFGSMTHAIRTVAAQLNEKDVDPELATDVMAKGIELYQSLCQAELASAVYDDFSRPRHLPQISVSLSYISTVLGIILPSEKILDILQILGCEATLENNQTLLIQPPSFRPDLEIPADIVEEIARIYGYHNLPSVLMETAIPTTKPKNLDLELEGKLKHFLADIGWQELYTYSLVSEQLAIESGFTLDQHLKLQNPLTDDKVVLRRSLIPSLKEILVANSQTENLSVFEVANVYHPQTNDLPIHELHLGFISKRDYRQVRGDFEALAEQLFIQNVQINPEKNPQSKNTAQARITATNKIGEMIELGHIFVTSEGWTSGEILMQALSSVTRKYPTYHPIPKTMPVIEDLTFTIPSTVLVGGVMDTIRNTSPLIIKVELKDVYQRNFTFTISYQNLEFNIDSLVVEKIRKNVVETLAKEHQVVLVGMLR